MPDLQDMLRKAREEEAQRVKRKITKGVRPDRILRGEIQFGDNGQVISQPEFLPPYSANTESSFEPQPTTQNPEQSQNKVPSQHRTKSEQTQNKVGTKPEQTILQETKSQNKASTQPRTHHRTKSEQTQNKVRASDNFLSLVGLQKRIVLFVYDLCRAKGERTTGSVSLEQLAIACETTPGAAQVTTRRLMQKRLLRRATYKDGRGGWTNYELPEEVYGDLFQLESQNKLVTNAEQSQNKVPSQPRTQPRTNASSSSSSFRSTNKELLTTGNQALNGTDLDTSWQAVDCSPLMEIRFGRPQVSQLARDGRLTPEELQESIYAFAFDLSENQKMKSISGVPLNYFMGILRKGPYAPPANYEEPEDRHRRLYLEAKEQQRKRRQEVETRLETVEFEEWAEGLSLEKRAELVPPKDFAKPGSTAHTVQLREYFRENVWPGVREKTSRKNGDGI